MKRASRVLRTAPVWASLLLLSAHAFADDAPRAQQAQAAKGEANPGAPADDDAASKATPEQAAAVAYQKALASYAQGEVAAALDSMRQSYQLSKRAELLYNLAQLEEELKACEDSLKDYRRYLELVPHGRYREAAELARERLEHECPAPAATPAPAAAVAASTARAPTPEPKQSAAKPEPASYWTTRRVIGWSAIATGTLAGVGALYFQLEAIQARNDYQKSVDAAAKPGGPPPDQSLQDRQHRTNDLAIVLGTSAGALVAGGALVLLLDPGKQAQHSRSARLYAAPGLVGAWYAQSF
ncbi:MAG: hypothetical protein WDO69_03005 [Pseudomonadota bacterium]